MKNIGAFRQYGTMYTKTNNILLQCHARSSVLNSNLNAPYKGMCENNFTRWFGISTESLAKSRTMSLGELKLQVCGARHTDALLTKCSALKSCTFTVFHVNFSSRLSAPRMDYYEILGVDRSASHEEIKSSYYKLSKLYHPDRNKGNEDVAVKFHEVSAAYEVLGNYKLRKMYDKGLLPSEYIRETVKKKVDDHPIEHEAFYTSRSQRTKVPGEKKIFDVDDWTKEHYDRQRKDHLKSKERFEKKDATRKHGEFITNLEYLLLILVILIIVFGLLLIVPSPKK